MDALGMPLQRPFELASFLVPNLDHGVFASRDDLPKGRVERDGGDRHTMANELASLRWPRYPVIRAVRGFFMRRARADIGKFRLELRDLGLKVKDLPRGVRGCLAD